MRPPLVLAYHGLGSYARSLDPNNLMVTPERFAEQLRTLRQRDYRFLKLSEFSALVTAERAPAGHCALTFDDGSLDNLTVLAPLLVQLGIPATVFVCPKLLGQPHFAMPPAAGVRLMNSGELRRLAAIPLIEIGSHTNEHTDLSDATAELAYREMVDSRHALQELIQQPVACFAFPGCGYSRSCPDAARAAGYDVAVTCGGRGGWRRFELTRESVDSLDGRLGFALKSRGLFWPLRDSVAGRLARRAARSVRHGRNGSLEGDA